MNKPLKLIKIGNSTGVVLPKDILAKLRVDVGDELHVGDVPGGVKLTAHNPDFAQMMDAAEQIMREDRDILHVLAK
jgi:putative addiction module antidote